MSPEELPQLRNIAAELNFSLEELPEPALSDPASEAGTLESDRQDLNDLYNLFEAAGTEAPGSFKVEEIEDFDDV